MTLLKCFHVSQRPTCFLVRLHRATKIAYVTSLRRFFDLRLQKLLAYIDLPMSIRLCCESALVSGFFRIRLRLLRALIFLLLGLRCFLLRPSTFEDMKSSFSTSDTSPLQAENVAQSSLPAMFGCIDLSTPSVAQAFPAFLPARRICFGQGLFTSMQISFDPRYTDCVGGGRDQMLARERKKRAGSSRSCEAHGEIPCDAPSC